MRSITLATLVVIAVAGLAERAAADPVGQYVLTAGDEATNAIVQGATVQVTFPQIVFEYPVAVPSTIRTTDSLFGGAGGEYLLDGTFTGNTFANSLPDEEFYDGTTDGTFNYAVTFGSNLVYRFDLDWSNPVFLFALPGGNGAYLGSTYDPFTGTLWVSGWDHDLVENYALDGTFLGGFSAGSGSITCLALDPSDGTLWFGHQDFSGTYENWTTGGGFIGSTTYPSISDLNTLGGEFPMPQDDTAPTIDCTLLRRLLWTPSRGMIDVGLGLAVTDDTDATPSVFLSVYSDEDNGPAPYSPDVSWDGTTLRLRAERAVPGDGRVYLISIVAFDDAGNFATECCTVVVPIWITWFHLNSVRTQASAAEQFCRDNFGSPPPDFTFVGGDGED
jgi:hypothetical protein